MDEPSAAKRPSVLTIDRAAFLLLRVKRAFKKKRQQRKEKQIQDRSIHSPGHVELHCLGAFLVVATVDSGFQELQWFGNSVVLAGLQDIEANLNPHIGAKSLVDLKRRSEIVDEAFLEQKDILLEMLETKLKEVRDKRKKKAMNGESNVTNNNLFEVHDKASGKHLDNVDVKLNVRGIGAVGDSALELKYKTGKGSVNMDAHGISNIGNMHVEIGVGETGPFIPGLTDLFVDGGRVNIANNIVSTEAQITTTKKPDESRRSGQEINVNETTTEAAKVVTKVANATIAHNTHKHHTTVRHHTKVASHTTAAHTTVGNHTTVANATTVVANASQATETTVMSTTVQVWNKPDSTGSNKTDVLPLVNVNATVTTAGSSTV